MLKILINAYACSPDMGSEPGMAWNWCINLANYCELYIITEGEFRAKIESVLPKLEQGRNMHFYYNPVSDEVRKMCWNQGDWRFYKHYKQWQFKTYKIAREIVVKEKIDILHQLNMIGFREPGYLWKIDDIPFVWGPVDAKLGFPVEYLNGSSLKTRAFIYLKNLITKMQLRTSKRVQNAVKRASFVISASTNSQKTFKDYFGFESPLINETGCSVKVSESKYTLTNNPFFEVLWVGKMDFRKQLALALESLRLANNQKIRINIVGGGDTIPFKNLAKRLKIENRCIWHGVIDHSAVQQLMHNSDVFLFTSVAEGTPHVVLEAIANGLPVLCFNTCGQGDAVNSKVGCKIDLTNPVQSAKEFAEHLDYLSENRELLHHLSENCKERQLELSWDNKAEQMINLYHQCLSEKI